MFVGSNNDNAMNLTASQEQFLDQVAAHIVTKGIESPTFEDMATAMQEVMNRQRELMTGYSEDAAIFRRVLSTKTYYAIRSYQGLGEELDAIDQQRRSDAVSELTVTLKHGPEWQFA